MAGLCSRSRTQLPRLTPTNRMARLQFAREHVNWTETEWRNVYFSDEARFRLYNENSSNSVMIWGCIWLTGRTDLIILPASPMTSSRYVNEVLQPYILPLKHQLGQNFVFMQDNARSHTARKTMEFLVQNEIKLLNHPPDSSDLNPIEYIWDKMEKLLQRRKNQPQNLNELEETLRQIWHEIPKDFIRKCINIKLQQRLQVVIEQRGDDPDY